MSLKELNAEATEKIYKPLEDNCIRLVTIHGAKSRDEPIHASLQIVQISTNLTYEALSYVWGSSTNSQSISVDGVRFYVTPNLHLALTYLRREETNRVLWIDAIAINQANEHEKNSQVQKMHEVYRSARLTIAWLGPVYSVQLTCGHIADANPNLSTSIREISGPLLERLPYWKRVWVVQEAVLSQRVIFQYGATGLSGHEIRESWQPWFETSSLQGPLEVLWFRDRPLRRRVLTFRAWAQALCPRLQCQDPRDKVFGFYYLFPEELIDRISIDYGRSVAEVYTEVTWHFINHDQALQCINLGDGWKLPSRPSTPGLPSWVPDYDMPSNGELTYEPMWQEDYAMPDQFHAHLFDDNTTLWLKGIRVGSCTTVQNLKGEVTSTSEPKPGTLRLFWSCSRLFGQENVASNAFIFAFGGPGTSEDSHLRQLRALIFSLPTKEEDTDHAQYELDFRALLGVQQIRWLHSQYTLMQFTSPLALRSRHPELLLPSDSGFGIALRIIQPRDEIWMIAGCKNPVILRRVGDKHEFISNSFIPEFANNWIHPETANMLEQMPLEDVYLQ